MAQYLLEWGDNRSVPIGSSGALDHLLDQIGRESTPQPQLVTLVSPTGATLTFAVGGSASVVMFQFSLAPPYFTSVGREGDDGVVVFDYRGEGTEIPIRHTVSPQEARRAMHLFLKTGQRPDNVEWKMD